MSRSPLHDHGQKGDGSLHFRDPGPPPLPKLTELSIAAIWFCISVATGVLLGGFALLLIVTLFPYLCYKTLRFADRLHKERWRKGWARQLADAFDGAKGRTMLLPDWPEEHGPPETVPVLPEELRSPEWNRASIEHNTYQVHARDVGMALIEKFHRRDPDATGWMVRFVSGDNRDRLRALLEIRIGRDEEQFAELAEIIGAVHEGYDLDDIAARPELERPATAETDCRNGHYGLMDMGEIITGRDGARRVRRSCGHCESQWSDLA